MLVAGPRVVFGVEVRGVLDLADEGLDDVLERDDPERPAALLHLPEVAADALQVRQHDAQRLVGPQHRHRPQPLQRQRLPSRGGAQAEHVLGVDEAEQLAPVDGGGGPRRARSGIRAGSARVGLNRER